MNTLGQRIAYYRKRAGLTQEELAEKCSVTPQAVSKWENDISSPDISLLPTLSRLLNVSCDELLGAVRTAAQVVPEELRDFDKCLIKIRVLSADGDEVNVNLPLSLAELFLESSDLDVAGDALSKIDISKIIELVKHGAVGKLLEVKSSKGDLVEIWVE